MLRLRLEYWRKRRAMTIDELAEKAHVSTSTIANVEKRQHFPQPKVVRRLAEALNVPLDDFIVDVEDEQRKSA